MNLHTEGTGDHFAAAANRRDVCLHAIFRKAALDNPGRIAVRDSRTEWTYRELDSYSDQLAGRIIDSGARRGALVAIYLDRSVELIGAVLGVLKAGAAYVPIDTSLPPHRVEWLLDNSGALHVVTDRLHSPTVQGVKHILPIDGIACTPGTHDTSYVESASADAAYVIYTSGSTGEPKGVLIEHGNIVALLEQTRKLFDFGCDDVWTLFHSISFDFSVWEIFGALLHGGLLTVVSHAVSREPAALLQLLRQQRVTVLNQTPSAFGQLVRREAREADELLSSLRLIILGGERLQLSMLQPWMQRYPDGRPKLVNMYGITEITVHGTCKELRSSDLAAPGVSPIGVPLPGYRFHVLDSAERPVACEQPGELYVAGSGVARGYLNRPDLTAERFRVIRSVDSGTLYKTGDIVSQTRSGEYLYHGRADDQIKVRGFRIEPREIEMCLDRHRLVAQSAVAVADHGEGDVRLNAYLVPSTVAVAEGHSNESMRSELSAHARANLASHMNPSCYFWIEKLPLTLNGKIDRAALSSMRTGLEGNLGNGGIRERLIAIWREMLPETSIPSDVDFFDIGGTSLALTRILSRVHASFGVDIPLTALFSEVTVDRMVAAIDAALTLDTAKEHAT